MKFVGLIQKNTIEERELEISIPHYHRSSMGLVSRTSVYAIPRYYTGQSGTEIREIILTPFRPENWGDLWKIEMTTKEFPGVVKQITSVLAKEKINILVQESLTTEQERTHMITIIGDMIKYEGDGYHYTRINKPEVSNLPNLKKNLENLKNDRGDIIVQSIAIKRMEFLSNNCMGSKDVEEIYGNQDFLTNPASSLIDKRKVKLPYRILKYLKVNPDIGNIYASIFSDTEEKYLIVHLFNNRQNSIALNVVHEDALGAIAAFTDTITKVDKRINILNCFNRIESMSHISHWNAILDITPCERSLDTLLSDLMACEYNSFCVKHVWLTDYINKPDDDLILKYGAVRWKENGKLTYLSEQKRKLIIEKCKNEGLLLEEGKEKNIIKALKLQGSKEEELLLEIIIHEEIEKKKQLSNEKQLRKRKIINVVVAIIIVATIIPIIVTLTGRDPFEIAREQFKAAGKYAFLSGSLISFYLVYTMLEKYGNKIKHIFHSRVDSNK